MPGRTPTDALLKSIEPVQRALNFITVGRLTFGRASRDFKPGAVQSITFNGGNLAPIRSSAVPSLAFRSVIWMRLQFNLRQRQPYDCEIASYWHAFEIELVGEVLAYHWTPLATGKARTDPHMNVGSLATSASAILPGRFHKLHLPTGFVTVEDIVRFAIEELGAEVRPRVNRDAALAYLAKASSCDY